MTPSQKEKGLRTAIEGSLKKRPKKDPETGEGPAHEAKESKAKEAKEDAMGGDE